MSIPAPFPKAIPEQTRQIVETWLDQTSLFGFLAEQVDAIISDADFADLYATSGRPGVNAVILTLVTVFQFLEDLPDRVAAAQVRSRMDWKYVLRQDLTWTGFNYTDLCNFRKRLAENEEEGLVFEKVLVYLKENGYIKKGGKQRTDASHVLGKLRKLSRLELVLETLREALSAIVSSDAHWFVGNLPASYSDTYQVKRYDYRMKTAEIEQMLKQAGQDGVWLLEQVQPVPQLADLEALSLLARVLREQFKGESGAEIEIDPDADCADGTIQSPHEPEAGYGKKRGTSWQGYKVHVSDTADEGQAHFITDIEVRAAHENDHQALTDIQARLAQADLLPDKQYVDQGYMSGKQIAVSREQGIDLRGYVQATASSKAPGFRLEDFEVDMAQQVAICPDGKQTVRWVAVSGTNNVAYRADFGKQCRDCPFFKAEHCTTNRSGRRLDLSAHHDDLQQRRTEMQEPAFQKEMQTRHGIEGTISELVRKHGLRQARYRGQRKMQFQAYFTALAFNLKRLAKAYAILFFEPILTFFNSRQQATAFSKMFFNTIIYAVPTLLRIYKGYYMSKKVFTCRDETCLVRDKNNTH
jgi:transposase